MRSGAPPPPTARQLGGPFGSATHVLWARVPACGGPTLSPWPACPVGAACRGGGGGPSPGGLACRHCEGRLVPGAVPPPAACPLGRAARVPRPVCPGCGRCGLGDPAQAPRRAPMRAGVARCGGGGRASPGGGAVRRSEGGLGSGVPPLPAARPLGGLPGLAGHVLWARVWVCAVCVVSVRCVSWCVVPLFSCPSGAPLSGASVRCGTRRVPCACRAPLPARVTCSAAGYPLFVASSLFSLSSARLSPWHALFPCLCPGVCPCLSLRRLSPSLRPVRQEEGWGYVGLRRALLAPRSSRRRGV